MATITITPRYKSTNPDFVETGFKAGSLSNALIYMWGKQFTNYRLLVNGREYEWPNQLQLTHLHEHIDHCIEIDEAFYGTH